MAAKEVFDVDAAVKKLVGTDNIKEKEVLAREIQAQAKAQRHIFGLYPGCLYGPRQGQG